MKVTHKSRISSEVLDKAMNLFAACEAAILTRGTPMYPS